MSPGPTRWPVERSTGSATAFHERPFPDPVRPIIWSFEVDGPAVVLGSTQRSDVIDAERAAAAGVEVVRRRSGGGAVWLAPGEVTWVDVILPAEHPRWVDDVGRSAAWLGQLWADALASLGVHGAVAHEGPMVRTQASATICFAGLAPGEVTVAGQKVVGVSQRRTRAGARFQCAVLHRWDPQPLVALLDLPDADRQAMAADLGGVATGIGAVPADAVVAALRAQLLAHA